MGALLAWAAAGVLALVLLALALPVRLALVAEAGPVNRVALRLRLFGGLLPWLALADSARPPRAQHEAPPPRRQGWRPPAGAGKRLVAALPGFLRRALGRVRIERIEVDADLGLGDPADTGQMFGLLMPLAHALPPTRARIALRPDFGALRCEGRLEAVLRLVPLALAGPLAGLAWAVLRGTR